MTKRIQILVITCPVCNRFASLDGKYRRGLLGRTIQPAHANGYQPHCSACESMAQEGGRELAERMEREDTLVPAWFEEEYK